MFRFAVKARANGRFADFVETLSMLVASAALLGLALVFIALLFSWATAAVAQQSPQLPTSTHSQDAQSGTLLLKPRTGAAPHAAPMADTQVSMQISGMIARVHVRQRFSNPSPDWYEGVYVFPLPENSAVDGLRMQVGERVIVGRIKSRAEAHATYEQAKQSGNKAALVEQQRPNIFSTSVANIAPNDAITVEIDYQQTLHYDQGHFSLRFPMVAGPRYIPGAPLAAEPGAATEQGSGRASNTDQVADASLITPPVLSPRMLGERLLNPVSINIELDAGLQLAALRSPTHDIRITAETDHRYRIEFESGQAPANRDFELLWSPAAADAPQAAVLHQDVDGERYALLMLMPTAAQTPSARLPRETIFVIDTSGSMDGTSIMQARQALLLALKGLMPQDRFNVIEFNSITHRLFANAVPATPHRLVHAAAWVSRLHAQGGTEMADALRAALNNSDDPRVLRQVIFLTDGSVGNEEQLFSLIRERLGDSRLFTIGIGSAPNSYFMSKAAQTGRGTFTYIGNVDEVAQKMGALFSKLEAPVLKNIHIDWPAGAEVWPQRMPDLYQGEPLFVSAKLEAAIDSVTLAGERNGQLWQARVKLRESGTAQGIDKLWARKKIEALMDGLHEGAAPDAVRQSVERVALAHGLVSKYTSLVAVELKPARPASEALHSGAVPTHLPDGWVEASVFGELPQTATAANWHLLLASIGSIVAGLLWLSTRRRAIAGAAA